MTLLELQDVTYRYKNTAEAVLYQIKYNFEPGKFYSIIGESGAGKSTLLSLLAGLDSPVEGTILFQGEDIRNKGYSYHRMHHISLVFQNYNLIDYLSPLENIRLVNKKISKDILLELGLDESQIKRNVLQLSGGQQQRVAIARAIAKNPSILFCDEPTGALDEETGKTVLEVLQRINEEFKTTIFLITHNLGIAEIADKVVRMRSGEIIDVTQNQDKKRAKEVSWV